MEGMLAKSLGLDAFSAGQSLQMLVSSALSMGLPGLGAKGGGHVEPWAGQGEVPEPTTLAAQPCPSLQAKDPGHQTVCLDPDLGSRLLDSFPGIP